MLIIEADNQQIVDEVIPFLSQQMSESYSWMDAEGLARTIEYKRSTLPHRFPEQGTMLYALDGSQIIATASLEPYFSPSGRAMTIAYCGNLFVHKDYQGQGVGKQMLQAREAAALEQGIQLLVCEVLSSNRKAQQFLLHNGFMITHGTRISSNSGETLYHFSRGLSQLNS